MMSQLESLIKQQELETQKQLGQLQKILEIIIIEMHKQRLLPPSIDLRTVVDNVMMQFLQNLKEINLNTLLNDLQNPEYALSTNKALIFCIMSEAVSMQQPESRIDYLALLKPTKKDELKNHPDNLSAEEKKLKEQFKRSLTAINNKLEPGMRLSEKELDELAEKLARAAMKKLLKNDKQQSLAHNGDLVDINIALTKALESLYGCDPRQAGKVAKPVLTVIGNYAGQIDLNTGGGPSFMGEQNVANPGSVDYTGKEGETTLINVLQIGVLAAELITAINEVIAPAHRSRLPNPFPTKPWE